LTALTCTGGAADNRVDQPPLLPYTTNEGKNIVYISQHNVDIYFSTEVVNMMHANKATIQCKLNALNWFLLNVENPFAQKIAVSPDIRMSMQTQQVAHADYCNRTYAGNDPHDGLKDLMSEEFTVHLVSSILELDTNSADMLFIFNWGKNGVVRGGSIRVMILSDLNVSYGFGPERDAPRNSTLLLILRKGKIHKEKHTTTKQVGVQSHRDYK
jgi:hypothetical protein